jgi:hypothetical protein
MSDEERRAELHFGVLYMIGRSGAHGRRAEPVRKGDSWALGSFHFDSLEERWEASTWAGGREQRAIWICPPSSARSPDIWARVRRRQCFRDLVGAGTAGRCHL